MIRVSSQVLIKMAMGFRDYWDLIALKEILISKYNFCV